MESAKKWLQSKSVTFWIIVIVVIILALIGAYNIKKINIEPNLDFIEDHDDREDLNDRVIEVEPIRRPVITKGKREEMCRRIFESIYGVEFKSCRPEFIRNPKTNRKLELDGYNSDLKIAFEYQGHQHYEFPNTFHRTEKNFRDQLYRDQYKRKRCNELGIYLISIPYHIKTKDLRLFIISKLPKDNLESLESAYE